MNPKTEIALEQVYYKYPIVFIKHPIDLRDELQYKLPESPYYTSISRYHYEATKNSRITLIFYED